MPRFSGLHLLPFLLSLSLLLLSFPPIKGGSCPGICQDDGDYCPTHYESGVCPGGNNVRCCVESTPYCDEQNQQCQNKNELSCSGTYKSNLCPGSYSIECCVSSTNSNCSSSFLFSIGNTKIYSLNDGSFYWSGGLEVDADGAPNAYNPSDSGIDYLANAGSPGDWWGISTDSSGTPYVQGQYPSNSYAPFPGYYVSTTSLEDPHFPSYDCRRFANAVNLTFFVLPWTSSVRSTGVKLGDLAYLYRSVGGKSYSVYAIFADTGPTNQIGEASVATHLGLNNNPYNSYGRVVYGIDSGVTTLVFPGSGNGSLLTQSEINEKGESVFESWGGEERFNECVL